ncbi:uncharacterized protein LOC131425999 [Malaya genurostris]|uniref:uncharacterized protein LOC131425999 n=1 Tax=Malaya genurostris TaxID=325434 RepID=UPI0026F3E478|nr:uncharacterized protein LOC131425999 [Malaya genurostris]
MDDNCSTAATGTEERNDPPPPEVHPNAPDPENQLLHMVRNCLEGDHYLRKVRCEMRRKVLESIQGTDASAPASSPSAAPPPAIQLINQLILEYFDWYNLQYSAEMFSVESETPRLAGKSRRQRLLSSLLPVLEEPLQFQPDLPVLAELIMKLMAVDEQKATH